MFKIRKLFKFEMAHALKKSYSQECQSIHGHSYILEVIIESASVNEDGMVIDFKLLKEIVNKKVISKFDHTLVLQKMKNKKTQVSFARDLLSYTGTETVFLAYNPTAEYMAVDIYKMLYSDIRDQVKTLVALKIKLHETATGYAEYTGGY